MDIRCIERRTLWRDRWYPQGRIFRDGSVFLGLSGTATGSDGGSFVSRDDGAAWDPSPLKEANMIHELSDGRILGFAALSAVQDKVRREQEYKPFIARIRRAQGSAALLAGAYEDDFVPIRVPRLSGGCGDADNYGTGVVWPGLVERADGALLLAMYGNFREDARKIPYFKASYQYRSWTVLSRDGGRSWEYLSTMASTVEHPLPELAEGYCEPDILDTGSGGVLAVMRTGGNPTPDGTRERFTPLVAVRSADGGATWSAPYAIAPFGVAPRLLRMRDGTVACLSGRPGFFLLLSADGGQSWSAPVSVTANEGAWRKSPSGYGTIGETEPGVLTVLYDDYAADAADPRLETRLARFSVGR